MQEKIGVLLKKNNEIKIKIIRKKDLEELAKKLETKYEEETRKE